MSENKTSVEAVLTCWAIAAGVAVLAFGGLMAVGGWLFIQAVFVAAVLFLGVGGLLTWMMGSKLPAPGEVPPAPTVSSKSKAPASAKTQSAPAAEPAPAAEAVSEPTAEEVVTKEPAPKPVAKKAAKKSAPAKDTSKAKASADATGDSKPATLSAARGDGPDDLKKIKGVGPKLEALLNSKGFYHFDQIAGWTDAELAWVDANLEGFKGRATRDNWIEQAKLLAEGGETDFSKKVDKGDVY